MSIVGRFWDKVPDRPENGCWIWAGRKVGGYGALRSGRTASGKHRWVRAHRLSWEIHNGPIPDGLQVLHGCDNPPCVRPDHLRVGTHADNMADKVARGRCARQSGAEHWTHRRPDHRPGAGERHASAKLTVELVRWVRSEHTKGRSITSLAQEVGVGRASVSKAINGGSWRHVS